MKSEFIAQPADHNGEVSGFNRGLVVTADKRKIIAPQGETKSATLAGLQINFGETLYSLPCRRQRCHLVAQVENDRLVTRSLSAVRYGHANVNLSTRRHIF